MHNYLVFFFYSHRDIPNTTVTAKYSIITDRLSTDRKLEVIPYCEFQSRKKPVMSETRGFKGEGDGKETGSEKNEEKEGGGAGKVKAEGKALGIFSKKIFVDCSLFLSCYWPEIKYIQR